MRSFTLIILFLVTVIPSQLSGQNNDPFQFSWNNGFKLQNESKSMNLKFGGRIMLDAAGFNQDQSLRGHIGDQYGATEFRRARLFNSGTIYHRVKYKFQLDFSGGGVDFKDMYISLIEIPVLGMITAGHFKEPIGLEELTSSKYITFMERSTSNSLRPSRNTGVQISNNFLEERAGYATGIFRETDNSGEISGVPDRYNYAARIFGTPVMKEDNKLIHLGGSFSIRKSNEKTFSVSVRPEAHLSAKLINLTAEDADRQLLTNFEMAGVWGPISFQSEWLRSEVTSSTSPDLQINAWYTLISGFLTGESRNYDDGDGTFGRVKPKKNWGDKGFGAIELAARYSSWNSVPHEPVSLRNTMQNITGGINWYLNPSTRMMLNYVHSFVSLEQSSPGAVSGKVGIWQVRFQVDF